MTPTDVVVPQTNANDEEARVVEWLVADGSQVRSGEAVVTIETAKTAEDIEAPVDGYIRILAEADAMVAVGASLATVAAAAQHLPPVGQQPSAGGDQVAGDIVATAKARELAQRHGLDLARLQVDGIISERHVRQALGNSAAPSTDSPGPQASPAADDAARTEPLTAVQKAVAATVTRSHQEIGSAFLVGQADITDALDLLDQIIDEEGVVVTLTDLAVHCVARVLADYPRLNATLVGESLQLHDQVNVGVAVEVNGDLYLPTIRAAQAASLIDIATARQELVMALFRGEADSSSLAGGTFSVTVLEQAALLHQVPVIFPGQAGILGLGGVRDAFVPDAQGAPQLRKLAGLAVSYDHRIVNGAYAAAFLQAVADRLQTPGVSA